MDQALTPDQHVKCQVIHSCFFRLRNIAKLRPIVSQVEMEILICTFISSRLDYHNSLFACLGNTSLDRLQVAQNAAAKLISLHWLPIKLTIHYKVLVTTYRAMPGQASAYIRDLLQRYITRRSLRYSDMVYWLFLDQGLKLNGTVLFRLWLLNALPLFRPFLLFLFDGVRMLVALFLF